MFKLVIQDDEGKTTVVPLIRDEITIGRKEGNTIRLTERNVSRRHARILRNNGEVQIEDLGSYNGIRVNNARIAERVSLRISDQVQIGDYKLYLKAEGVEQVDDARTMPIERIENQPPTEVMPAIQPPVVAPPPPTAPMPAQPVPASGTAPQRAVPAADSDTGGRPVATAAQVAALTQPAAYGKLVVVSSNLARKEFELTRPQMIIGRTDENDIVIAHRSISRNHAKITRDPETQRYTIGDLQSSNGVRVNGQDYSKVELRRGDIVDLGHVRLRFIEPGEDFVFDRDAVIADVEQPGGKRGLVLAAVFALVVIAGAIAAVMYLRQTHKQNGVTGAASNGGGSETNVGSNPVVATAPIDAPGSAAVAMVGSDGSDTQVGSNPQSDKLKECHQDAADKKWSDLQHCADELAATDAANAKLLKAQALSEARASRDLTELQDALPNLTKARRLLDKIPQESVYRPDAEKAYDAAESTQLTRQAHDAASRHRCGDVTDLANRARTDELKQQLLNIPCENPVAVAPLDCSSTLRDKDDKHCVRQFCGSHGDDPRCGGPAQPQCNADADQQQGMQKYQAGDNRGALASFEASLRCRYDSHVNQLAFIAACGARDASHARIHYLRMSAGDRAAVVQSCVGKGITVQQLTGP